LNSRTTFRWSGRTRPSIVVVHDGGRPVVHLRGDLDLTAVDTLNGRLRSLENGQRRPVVIDLGSATFLDSTIVGALVAAHRNGLDLTIRGASGHIRRALERLGISEVFPFED
jgi:anti-anti-sigma factor